MLLERKAPQTKLQADKLQDAMTFLKETSVASQKALLARYPKDNQKKLSAWAKQPETKAEDLVDTQVINSIDKNVFQDAMTMLRYEGYIAKRQSQVKRLQTAHERVIPSQFVYESVKGLSSEIVEKLNTVRPTTLGQASRISGMTPAALSLIAIFLTKRVYGLIFNYYW